MKCETKCIRSTRSGRFKVSLLEQTKTFQQRKEIRDVSPEKEIVRHSVAVQYGQKVDGKWQNTTIFCTTQEFRNLQNAIDEFTQVSDEEDNKPSNSTTNKEGDEQ